MDGIGVGAVVHAIGVLFLLQQYLVDCLSSPPYHPPQIAGPPGCGKSTLLRVLAQELGFNLVELQPAAASGSWEERATVSVVSRLGCKSWVAGDASVCSMRESIEGAEEGRNESHGNCVRLRSVLMLV